VKEVLLYDGQRYITLPVEGYGLAYVVTALASPTLRRIAAVGQEPKLGVNGPDAMRAIQAEIARREANATMFDRAVTAARDAHVGRRWVSLEPVLTNYGKTS
jgi:hypothetical protein